MGSSQGGSGSSQVGTSPPSATNKAKPHLKRDGDSQLAYLPADTSSRAARILCASRSDAGDTAVPLGCGLPRVLISPYSQPCLPKGEAFFHADTPGPFSQSLGSVGGETRCLEPKKMNIREVN